MSKINCQKCQKQFETMTPELGGVESRICPHCGTHNPAADLSLSSQASEPEKPVQESAPVATPQQEEPVYHEASEGTSDSFQNDEKVPCDWELNWKETPVKSFIETVKSVLTEPAEFFRKTKPVEDYFSLIVFIFICMFITTFFSMIYQLLFQLAMGDPTALMSIPFLGCALLFAPIIAIPFIFLWALIIHVCMVTVGGSEKSFGYTATVYCLGAATSLVGIIPLIGGVVAFFYNIVVQVIGQSEAHDVSRGRSVIAVLLPLIVVFCCFGLIMLGSVFMVGGLAAFMEGVQP